MIVTIVLLAFIAYINNTLGHETFHNRMTKATQSPILSRIYFNVQNPLDGSYYFSYDTGFYYHQSFREERRDPSGTVTGIFGYVDKDGVLRLTQYTANQHGYRARISTTYLVRKHSYSIIGPIPFYKAKKQMNNDIIK